MAPILLPSNQPEDRFYKGGNQISDFRSEPRKGEYRPEDWVGSTTCCAGCESSKIGMSVLPDGRLLSDAVEAAPEAWLGPDHVLAFGADTKLLLKLLDAGQRLPVHAHPHRDWAREHVGARHGKAECWYALSHGEVHLGLTEDVSAADLLSMVEAQDVSGMLSRMHRITVEPHQVIYVPPGMLHSIGKGIMVVELQEPEDLSVLLEWQDFAIDGAKDGHLGLGFPTALKSVDRKGRSAEEISKLVTPAGTLGSVVASESREYFELHRVKVDGEERYPRGFAIVVGLDGEAELATSGGEKLLMKRGSTVLMPYEDGIFTLTGTADVLIARPPAPNV